MPGFDGTGPAGMGPMTGGGRGACVTPAISVRPNFFRGRGLGRGMGRGRRNMYYSAGFQSFPRGAYGNSGFGMRYAAELPKEEEAMKRRVFLKQVAVTPLYIQFGLGAIALCSEVPVPFFEKATFRDRPSSSSCPYCNGHHIPGNCSYSPSSSPSRSSCSSSVTTVWT